MTFKEALKKLDIEDYAERIFNSSSTGELYFLYDYIYLAELLGEVGGLPEFRSWFEGVVKYAEQNWKRPESIFQHILKVIRDEEGKND